MKLILAALFLTSTIAHAEFFDTEKRTLINMGQSCGLKEDSSIEKWDACFAIHYLMTSDGIGNILFTASLATGVAPDSAASAETFASIVQSIAVIERTVDANFEIVTGEAKEGSVRYNEYKRTLAEFGIVVYNASKTWTNADVAGLTGAVVPLKRKLVELVSNP